MQIEYVANGSRREVRDSVGETLIARKIARPVYRTREISPADEERHAPISSSPKEASAEISPRTGKPKRQYKRRDMRAEG